MTKQTAVGKTALIPGASRAVGRAIAARFAEADAKLILPVYDWEESIAEMEAEFCEKKIEFCCPRLDLRKKSDVLKLRAAIENSNGSLHYLINNIERGGMPVVHGGYDLPHNDTPYSQWQREIDTTLTAKWLLFHHCLPLMTEGGAVVNITSVAGEIGRSGGGAPFFADGYSAANRAVRSFTETWAREAAPKVRVNEVVLGLIRHRHGEETRGWGALTQKEQQEVLREILLERTGRPEEVAELVYFIAKAQYMTGSVVHLDGGFRLGSRRIPDMPKGIL